MFLFFLYKCIYLVIFVVQQALFPPMMEFFSFTHVKKKCFIFTNEFQHAFFEYFSFFFSTFIRLYMSRIQSIYFSVKKWLQFLKWNNCWLEVVVSRRRHNTYFCLDFFPPMYFFIHSSKEDWNLILFYFLNLCFHCKWAQKRQCIFAHIVITQVFMNVIWFLSAHGWWLSKAVFF